MTGNVEIIFAYREARTLAIRCARAEPGPSCPRERLQFHLQHIGHNLHLGRAAHTLCARIQAVTRLPLPKLSPLYSSSLVSILSSSPLHPGLYYDNHLVFPYVITIPLRRLLLLLLCFECFLPSPHSGPASPCSSLLRYSPSSFFPFRVSPTSPRVHAKWSHKLPCTSVGGSNKFTK